MKCVTAMQVAVAAFMTIGISVAAAAHAIPFTLTDEAPSYLLVPASDSSGVRKVAFPWVTRKAANSALTQTLDETTASTIVSALNGEGNVTHVTVPGAGTVPLKGNIIHKGEYFVEVKVRDQSFYAQVDTGSSDFAVPAEGCGSTCGKPPHPPLHLAGLKPVGCFAYSACLCEQYQCAYTLQYLDGTGFHAKVYEAFVSFPPSQVAGNATVGAIVREYHGFATPGVDGIIGFWI